MQLNPTKPLAGIFVMLAFVYGLTIFLTSDPLTRIDRTCAPPFLWPEKMIVAGAKIMSPGSVPGIEDKFDHGYNVCRQWVWNAFFADEARKLEQQSQGKGS